ncbi:MAG: glycosyltransferase [Kiritimatiellae bacterium]|nr:glycosyltransferase [Kiritimatiellia bacterium]
MKVSIITACYNAEKTISDAMESVARQRVVGDWCLADGGKLEIEYIVVDGGSTDGTVGLIKEWEKKFAEKSVREGTDNTVFRWVSEKDRGMYDAINKGIRMATGDVIGILNADDRLEDEKVLADIAQVMSVAEGSDSTEAAVDAVYGDIRFVRGEGKETVRYYSSKPWKPWMHNWGYMPAHPTVYVRREVFEKFGGYKLGYDISADFEWMTRVLCRHRIKAKYLPRCMVTMRLGGKSTAGLKAMLKLNQENVRANRENGYFCCLPMMLPKYAYKILGYLKKR